MRVADIRAAIAERLADRCSARLGLFPDIRADVVEQLTRHHALGNRKLPRRTAIFNPGGSALDCESARLGLCRIPAGLCYAGKAERAYPGCLPYRDRQRELFTIAEPVELAAAVLELQERHGVTSWRLSESGDYRSQADVSKAVAAAELLAEYGSGLRSYCYTARSDLDYPDPGSSALVFNGSGFRPGGPGGNVFVARLPRDIPAGSTVCPGDCRSCSLCSRQHGRIVHVKLH